MSAPTPAQTSRPGRPGVAGSGLDSTLPAITGAVALGMLLTTLPLRSIFTDWAWLTVSIGCALPYLAVVALARSRTTPRWWHSAVGLAASLLMLLWVFVPQHLALGVVPTGGSFGDLSSLIRTAHDTVQREHAPLASTQALRLWVAAALVALAVLTDVLAVLLRHPLLASAPLLEVLVVASATSSRASNPIWFAAAALGFLLIMLAGTKLQDRAWGPSVDGTGGRLGGARRMAVTGVVAALIVPAVLPSASVNVLARAAHHNGGGSGSGGGGGSIVLNSLASLRGSLQRPTPVDLFQVQVTRGSDPFYIRQEVDDTFTNDGWQPSVRTSADPAAISPLGRGQYPVSPESNDGQPTRAPTFSMNAKFTILALGGTTLPILANPAAFDPPSDTAGWNSQTSSAFGVSLKRNMTYTETVQQPAPKVEQLQASAKWTGTSDPTLATQLTSLPPQPDEVVQLASRLTSGQRTPYDKARAISTYFTNPQSGFSYALSAPPNDGRNALVTFLDKKVGYCQQYAAAAGVLMREAGLPARVVIGYTHHTPDANGVFTVTTSDAHAWVEVFFDGIGWVPFDPTPLAGPDSARAVALPWATHNVAPVQTAEATANRGRSATPSAPRPKDTVASVAAPATKAFSPVWRIGLTVLVLILVLLAVVLGPRMLRRRLRRRRLDRARSTGNPETLWQEVAATAADHEVLWPDTVTVGQVPGWLSDHGVDAGGRLALTALASRVERDRFSARPSGEIPEASIAELDQALSRWARRTDRRLRLVHRWIPRSLIGSRSRWSR